MPLEATGSVGNPCPKGYVNNEQRIAYIVCDFFNSHILYNPKAFRILIQYATIGY